MKDGIGVSSVRVEKLDTVYCCQDCKIVFLFKADVLDHQQEFGHSKMQCMPLE